MKRFSVTTSTRARADIADISRWLQNQGVSVRTIRAYVGRIRARCRRIGGVPFGGEAREDYSPGVRIVPFEHSATILYRVEADRVLILRILRRGRDVDRAVRS